MDVLSIKSSLIRNLIFIIITLALSSCGGSGGNSDDEELEVVIKGGYTFTIGGLIPGSNEVSYIEATSGEEYSLRFEPNVVGTIICDQTAEICELQSVDEGSSILVDDLTDSILSTAVPVIVDNFILFPSGSETPVSGRISINLPSGFVFVTVANCEGGSVGISLGQPDNNLTCFTWDDFEALADNPESEGGLISLIWQSMAFIVDQALNTLEVFPPMVDDVFALTNPVTDACEIFSGNWIGGPSVNPGDMQFFWDDDNSNNQVGPGDSLSQTFNECWLGDNSEGVLIEGMIDYVGYLEEIDNLGLLTRIGFDYVELGSGIDPIVFTETVNDNNEVITSTPMSLIGRYAIDFN